MTPEQSFLIQILRDHLHGNRTESDKSINWNTLLLYARIHQVEGIVFYQCKKFIPSDRYEILDQKLATTLFYYKNRERAANEIGRAFDRERISYFMVKGMEIAAYYPIPALRTMGDLDIVVQKTNKLKAGEVLEALGYSCAEKAPDYDWNYKRDKIHVELHHQLSYVEPGWNKKQAVFFNQCWRYVNSGKLDLSFHFLFALAHLQKHLMNSGAGFRMFMDLATIIKNDPGLNWLWIEEKLKLLGMGKFSGICFALCERWFGVKTPISYEKLSEEFAEEATEKIFTNGIFGFNDKNNKYNVTINNIIKNGKARKLSRVQMVLRHMFPRYMHMRYIPYYRFVEGRPWLLPAAWIYRSLRMLTGKTDNLSHFIDKVRLSDEEVDVREEEMRRWGLLEQ